MPLQKRHWVVIRNVMIGLGVLGGIALLSRKRVAREEQIIHPANHQQDPTTDHQNVNPVGSANHHLQATPSQTEAPNQNRTTTAEWINVILTALTLFAAIIAGYIYYGQWQAANGQLAAVLDQNRINARSARRQLEAAERQLAEMQTGRMLDERAWVTPYAYAIEPLENGGVDFKILIRNTGKTPALNLSYWTANALASGDDALDKRFKDAEPRYNVGILAPQATTTLGSPAVDGESVNKGKGGSGLYSYGALQYDDIFTNHHRCQFCIRATGDMKQTIIVRDRNFCEDDNSGNNQAK